MISKKEEAKDKEIVDINIKAGILFMLIVIAFLIMFVASKLIY